ncbi:uncharacterized protein LOC122093073, partial [Macadamia integrifolia]|uniref:uncharacterized protein LOC122093073 n=1 Tax=Macadamia integrifolia TaxID=60698 RepID=UPI001C532775
MAPIAPPSPPSPEMISPPEGVSSVFVFDFVLHLALMAESRCWLRKLLLVAAVAEAGAAVAVISGGRSEEMDSKLIPEIYYTYLSKIYVYRTYTRSFLDKIPESRSPVIIILHSSFTFPQRIAKLSLSPRRTFREAANGGWKLSAKMKISGITDLPALLSSKTLNPNSPDLNILHRRSNRRPQAPRRKIRNRCFSGSGGVRLKKDITPVGKRSGHATPLLQWKFEDANLSVRNDRAPEPARKGCQKMRNVEKTLVSARKLAAALWQLQLPEVTGGAGDGRGQQTKSSGRLGLEPRVSHMGVPLLPVINSREYGAEAKDLLESPHVVSHPKNGVLYKVDPSLLFANSSREGATKWDPGYSKTSDEVYRFYDRMKLLEDQRVNTVSAVSALQVELEQARNRIHELETEHRSSKKKLEHFLRKLAEERAAWRNREHDKIRAIIDDVKDDLNRERKKKKRK